MNAAQLAKALGVTRRQISQWKKKGLPCERRGRADDFDAGAVGLWLATHGQGRQARTVETVDEVAEHFGVHRRTVYEWIKQRAPGKPGCYDLDAIAAWREARRSADADPDLAGPGSAGLERYRQARAGIAELELAQLRRRLVPRDEVHAVMDEIAGTLRNAGEILERHHGAEARQVLEDAIDNARRLLEQLDSQEESK